MAETQLSTKDSRPAELLRRMVLAAGVGESALGSFIITDSRSLQYFGMIGRSVDNSDLDLASHGTIRDDLVPSLGMSEVDREAGISSDGTIMKIKVVQGSFEDIPVEVHRWHFMQKLYDDTGKGRLSFDVLEKYTFEDEETGVLLLRPEVVYIIKKFSGRKKDFPDVNYLEDIHGYSLGQAEELYMAIREATGYCKT